MHACMAKLNGNEELGFFCKAYLGDGELDDVAMVMIKMGGLHCLIVAWSSRSTK